MHARTGRSSNVCNQFAAAFTCQGKLSPFDLSKMAILPLTVLPLGLNPKP